MKLILSFKDLILWSIVVALSLTQLFLYIPNLTCTAESNLKICTPQFTFAVVGSSTVAKEFLGCVREFLKLLSYLTIDMGWSNELTDPNIYDEENLIDTFQAQNIYRVNLWGFCKLTSGRQLYCASNEDDMGMDILGVLIKDIGLQLGSLSTNHVNNTELLGNSFLFTYHLAIKSLRNLIRRDKIKDNVMSKLLLGNSQSNGDSNVDDMAKNYSKGLEFAYWLMQFNSTYFIFQILEMVFNLVTVICVLVYGILLFLNKVDKNIVFNLKIFTCVSFALSTISFSVLTMYIIILKTMEPTETLTENKTWGLLQIAIGSGYYIGCARYFFQCVLLILTYIGIAYYNKPRKPRNVERPKQTPKDESLIKLETLEV